MEHTPLPECIDRLARIEQSLKDVSDNHLKSIYESLKEMRTEIKTTRNFFTAQFVLILVSAVAILVKFIG